MTTVTVKQDFLMGIAGSLLQYKDGLTIELEDIKDIIVADTEYQDEGALTRFATLRTAYKRVNEQLWALDDLTNKAPVGDDTPATSQAMPFDSVERSDTSRKVQKPQTVIKRPPIKTDDDALQTPHSGVIGEPDLVSTDKDNANGSRPKQENNESRSRAISRCRTCRIRHTRCDQRKPICSTCEESGRECMGYGPEPLSIHAGTAGMAQPNSNSRHSEQALPMSIIQEGDLDAATPKSVASFKYALEDMTLYFSEDEIMYNHIIELGGKAVELNCPVCHANCTSNGKFFNGANSFHGHVRNHRLVDLKSVQDIFERAAAEMCLREVDEADIDRIRRGEVPENVKKPNRGKKQETAEGAVKDTQASKLSLRAATHGNLLDIVNPISAIRTEFQGSGVEPSIQSKAPASSHSFKSPQKSSFKKRTIESDSDDSDDNIIVARRKTSTVPRPDVSKDFNNNALGVFESISERNKRQKRQNVRFEDRDEIMGDDSGTEGDEWMPSKQTQ